MSRDASDDASDAASASDAPEAPSVITVKGTVMGYWRHRIPGINVYLGDRVVRTDSNGQFIFNDVTPPYDVRIAVHTTVTNAVWLYRGFTRSDPTLQVRGAVPYHRVITLYSFPNLPAPSTLEGGTVPRTLQLAFGSRDFAFHMDVEEGIPDFEYATDWEGPASTSGTIHALLWDQTDTFGPPARFVAYDARRLTLQLGAAAPNTALDMTPEVIAAAAMTGTVSSYAPTQKVSAHLRFEDGAIMLLGEVDVTGSTFSILAPKIAGTTVSLVAFSGDPPDGEMGLVHKEGFEAGASGIHLDVPEPVTLVSPDDGTVDVGSNVAFQWSPTTSVALLGVSCPGATASDPYVDYWVITPDHQATLPALPASEGIALPKGVTCFWSVEIHGAFRSVDATAGAAGIFDSASYAYYGDLYGPGRDDGTYSFAMSRAFDTAP